MNSAFRIKASGMSKHVFRTDLRHQPVGEPLTCINASELFFNPDALTVEQCVHKLLAPDEICLGVSDKRAIMRGPRVVGYIRIVDACS
jgi:hypothetical protein